ncbi:hypothetical protein N7528_005476 [Penicillium herquei]|nr:hypothetical protein N7528_005476 [Penicillium herquei]
MSDKPIIVFVPGAWHGADGFDQVRSLLTAQGYDSEAISTPSVGSADPDNGLHADIEYTKSVLKGLELERLRDSDTSSELRMVKLGGVIMVVWMGAFVAPKGLSLYNMLGNQWLPWMIPKDEEGYCYSSQEEVIFYHDMTQAEQQKWISKLQPQTLKSFTEPAVYESWKDIPSMYIYCVEDQALPMVVQEGFVKTLNEPVKFHIDASHSPFLSKPDEVVKGLEIAVEVGQTAIEVR